MDFIKKIKTLTIDQILFISSVYLSVYFGFIYTYHQMIYDYALTGALYELLTIPSLIAVPLVLIYSLVRLLKREVKSSVLNFSTIIITTVLLIALIYSF